MSNQQTYRKTGPQEFNFEEVFDFLPDIQGYTSLNDRESRVFGDDMADFEAMDIQQFTEYQEGRKALVMELLDAATEGSVLEQGRFATNGREFATRWKKTNGQWVSTGRWDAPPQ